MSKFKIFGALSAMLALSALAAVSASATLWLKNGTSLTAQQAAETTLTFVFDHKGGMIGNLKFSCRGKLDVFVGPGAEDLVSKVLDLNGNNVTSANPLNCNTTEGNLFCALNRLALVWPDNLPWGTELILSGSRTYDNVFEDRTNGKGEPGYSAKCLSTEFLCKGSDRALFIENNANGAVLEFLGELKLTCSDGGEGFILGGPVVLGFTVS